MIRAVSGDSAGHCGWSAGTPNGLTRTPGSRHEPGPVDTHGPAPGQPDQQLRVDLVLTVEGERAVIRPGDVDGGRLAWLDVRRRTRTPGEAAVLGAQRGDRTVRRYSGDGGIAVEPSTRWRNGW